MYFGNIALAYRQAIVELYAAGCRNIQFDDPILAYFCSESMIRSMEERGIDHAALLDTYIATCNIHWYTELRTYHSVRPWRSTKASEFWAINYLL